MGSPITYTEAPNLDDIHILADQGTLEGGWVTVRITKEKLQAFIASQGIADGALTGAKLADSTIPGGKLEDDIELPGAPTAATAAPGTSTTQIATTAFVAGLLNAAETFLRLVLSGQSLTGSQATSMIDGASTWDTTGAPDLIKANVTDTASDAASNLINLKVGGASKFRVRKDGSIFFGTTRMYNGGDFIQLDGINGSGTQLYSTWGNWTTLGMLLAGNGIESPYYSGRYFRPADGVHEFLADSNPQTVRVYKTTDGTNLERVKMGWNGNNFEIKPEAGGTGTVRHIHISGLPTANPGAGILWNDGGTVKVGT